MKRADVAVVFFGAGPVAAQSLASLAENFSVEMVVTKPKPAHHRGNWPVADIAEKLKIPIRYVGTQAELETTIGSEKLSSQVGIVIDFGLIISAETISCFPFGIINSHFSLLPRHRGADPITYAILKGDQKTGVSMMKIVPALDEGPLIAQRALSMDPRINSIELTSKLIALSNDMIRDNLPQYLKGAIRPVEQPSVGVSYSHKVQKKDGLINWSENADLIERKIRAYCGWPRSRTKLKDMDVIISEAEIANETGPSGEFKIKNNELIVFCGEKSLRIIRIQPAGKNEMAIDEFLRGYQLN